MQPDTIVVDGTQDVALPFWGVCYKGDEGRVMGREKHVSAGLIDTVCLADVTFIRVTATNGEIYLYAPGTLTEIWPMTEELVRKNWSFA